MGVEEGSCRKLVLYPGGSKCLVWLKEDPIKSPKSLGDEAWFLCMTLLLGLELALRETRSSGWSLYRFSLNILSASARRLLASSSLLCKSHSHSRQLPGLPCWLCLHLSLLHQGFQLCQPELFHHQHILPERYVPLAGAGSTTTNCGAHIPQ